jgi:prepilin-type N-terminal cleavage/methylation domain-containing protein
MIKSKRFIELSRGFSLLELMAVTGIFGLTMAVSAVLLITSKGYGDIHEAQLQSKESARVALERISQELRLSSSSKVSIDTAIRWSPSSVEPAGAVVNFQIPVGVYGVLDLSASNELKWGSAVTVDHHIAYSVNGNSQLVRTTYAAAPSGGDTVDVVSSHIAGITFSRVSTSSSLIHIVITAPVNCGNRILPNEVLTSDIKLRN